MGSATTRVCCSVTTGIGSGAFTRVCAAVAMEGYCWTDEERDATTLSNGLMKGFGLDCSLASTSSST